MLFENIFKELNNCGVKYAVIGGIAVNLHGYSRATGDIDIVICLTDSEIELFIKAVKQLQFKPRVPVNIDDLADAQKRNEWILEKNMKVFSVYNPKNPLEHVDLLILPDMEIEQIIENRIILDSDGIAVPIAAISDLIRLKEKAGRERDAVDIKALKIIQDYQNGKH